MDTATIRRFYRKFRALMARPVFLPTLLPMLPRRAVYFSIAVYALIFLIVVPISVAGQSHRLLDYVMTQGALVAQAMVWNHSGSVLRADRIRELQSGFYVAGLVFKDNKQVPAVLSPQLVLDDDTPRFNAAHRQFFQRLRDAGRLLFGVRPWILIHHTQRPGVNDFFVAAYRPELAQLIWANIARLVAFNFLILVVLVVLLHVFLQRMLKTSVDALYRRLYRGRLEADEAGAEALALDQLQTRLQNNIDEQARLASLGAAAGKLAHDIRNLLASFQLIADRLMENAGASEQKMGQRLSISIERALSLCDWAAKYTSDQRDRLDLCRQPLAPIIDEVLTFVRLHDPRRHVVLTNACPKDFEIIAEHALVFRILYNLALNAVQAMQGQASQGMLRISALASDDDVQISVLDTGPGIDTDIADNLIMEREEFIRPRGTGLGMTIASDLAHWHGGKLTLERTDASGSHFIVHLPRLPKDFVEEKD